MARGAAFLSVLSVLFLLSGPAAGANCPDPGTGDFKLCYVDHTGIEIAVAWDPVPGATSYMVERDTVSSFNSSNHITYALAATITGFGDTGWPLDDFNRFRLASSSSNSPTYHLDVSTNYYYRVSAPTAGGTRRSNVAGPVQSANYLNAGEVVRGLPGDLWADVVLGRPRFGENTWWKTEPYGLQYGAGVAIDRNTSHPTHVFIFDGNHNRILGMASLGVCSGSSAPCSIDADCDGGTCTLMPGQIAPQVILGQPSGYDYGACNLDGTDQISPNREPATASTLCFMAFNQISVGETYIFIQAVVDQNHNLYVPDAGNNRVVMYRDPFNPANGTAAVAVWGQDTFAGTACNNGSLLWVPTMRSLCSPNAVDLDAAGNLWVLDAAETNSRVLRFPRDPNTGVIATTADLSLNGTSTPIIWHPLSMRLDPQGNVYVADDYGLKKFSAPQPGPTSPPQLLDFINGDPDYRGMGHFAFDPAHPGQLWAQISWYANALVDLSSQTVLKKAKAVLLRGLDVSQAGDLFSVAPWDYFGVYRLGANESPPNDGPGAGAFLNSDIPTLDSMMSVISITTAGNQLLVSDRYAVYFWNDYHSILQGTALTQPADGMWGLFDINNFGDSYIVRSDDGARIWINSRYSGLKRFQGPLTGAASPLPWTGGGNALTVQRYKDATGAIVPLPTGVTLGIESFLPVGAGDRVWIADDGHARVVRVVNLDGIEAPGQLPYVDVVLGQADWSGTLCNKGGAAARDTYCVNGQLGLDAQGNLFLQDNANAGGDGGTTRILRWNAGTIPDNPPQTLFNVLPDSVYGNATPMNFSQPCVTGETACTLRAAAFAGDQIMAVGGAAPYVGPRYPLIYLNKEASYQPQVALGDLMGFPSVSYVDPEGNLYVGDFDWQRVLVYKQPFAGFAQLTPRATFTPTNTSTRTATPTPTASQTPTITRTSTPTQTPTLSATNTATPTQTATRTPTSTPTQTLTPTPSPTPPCTQAGALNPCVSGTGSARTSCNVEWIVTPPPPLTRGGLRSTRTICYEGDPACDADGVTGNHSCSFLVTLCINNSDPRLPNCVASDVASIAVALPSARSTKPADIQNRATLEAQAGNGPGGFGVTVKRGLAAVFVGQPNRAANLCSTPLPIIVPVRQSSTNRLAAGHTKLYVRSTTTQGRRATAALRLECRPAL